MVVAVMSVNAKAAKADAARRAYYEAYIIPSTSCWARASICPTPSTTMVTT